MFLGICDILYAMEDLNKIRNFVIIAHIDHGKSTLADRFLEITGTVEARRMRPQYLDQLELERERGITIKMAPVRMLWHPSSANNESISNIRITNSRFENSQQDSLFVDESYILNLIDTPGHSDFSYEVSRALAAVEGAILLVDATKGIQAQTLSNFRAAKKAGLTIIGAVNKIDLKPHYLEKTIKALADLIGVSEKEIFRISGKTGEGAEDLLAAVIEKIPSPYENTKNREPSNSGGRALIFDSLYDDHKGILAYVRVFNGEFKAGEEIFLLASGTKCKIKELGYFAPELKSADKLSTGEIGYIATGLKEPALVKIGDTIIANVHKSGTNFTNKNISDISGQLVKISDVLALPGYKEPAPVVFISFYPDGKTKYEDLKKALERLRLTDAALSFEPDANEALGRGFKAGFLGQLHFEITVSRLSREFGSEFITSFPSIAYRVKEKNTTRIIKDAHKFPSDPDEVFEPIIRVEILTPAEYLNQIVNMKNVFDIEIGEIKNIGEQMFIVAKMPLRELIRDFDDQLKSVSAGFASFSYELDGEARAEVEKLEILVIGEVVPALTRIVLKKDVGREARLTVERLKKLLSKEQWSQAIQASVRGRIIARETIPALRKDVTGYLYGGDRTRKMKLWKKQKRGKEKLERLVSIKGRAASNRKISLSAEIFREILKK